MADTNCIKLEFQITCSEVIFGSNLFDGVHDQFRRLRAISGVDQDCTLNDILRLVIGIFY